MWQTESGGHKRVMEEGGRIAGEVVSVWQAKDGGHVTEEGRQIVAEVTNVWMVSPK